MLAALEAAIASLQILGVPDMPQQARRPTSYTLLGLRITLACRMKLASDALRRSRTCMAC